MSNAEQNAEIELEAILGAKPAVVGREADLDAILGQGGKPEPAKVSSKAAAREERLEESKGQLKRENLELAADRDQWKNRALRGEKVSKVAIALAGCMALLTVGSLLWAQAVLPRAMEKSFKIISYRENKALSANAVVLDEWGKKIRALVPKVAENPDLTPEEREKRLRTLTALADQIDTTKGGFLKQLAENEKETSVGSGFTYRDPYLKREVNLTDEMGGKVDLEQIAAEVRAAANVDESMQGLAAMMTSSVPMEEQARQQAVMQKQEGTLKTLDLTNGSSQIDPGKLQTGPNPATSRVEVK